MPLQKLIARLESIEQTVTNSLDAQLPNELYRITELQKQQLNDGINSEGELLMKNDGIFYPYAPSYTKYKRSRGGKVDRVDLKLTGKFHSGIRTYKTGKLKAHITSIDSKREKLETEFDNIFGLAEYKKEEFQKEYAKVIISEVKKQITSK